MMGDFTELVLEGFLDADTGEFIDGTGPGYPRHTLDRKQERAFRAAKPTKDSPCIVPGCSHKFRANTQYADFLAHYNAKHRKPC